MEQVKQLHIVGLLMEVEIESILSSLHEKASNF